MMMMIMTTDNIVSYLGDLCHILYMQFVSSADVALRSSVCTTV